MSTAKRGPDDKPFDFNLDAVKAEVDLAPFRVNWDGQRFEFVHMEELDQWGLAAAAAKGEVAGMVEMFRVALGDEQFKEFRKIKLPGYKAKALFDAWAEHSGVDPGELQGSTSS